MALLEVRDLAKKFSVACRNLIELLGGTGIQCPPIASYLDRLIEFVAASYARRRELEEAEAAGEPDDPLDPRPAA